MEMVFLNVIQGVFARIASKITPIVKLLSMKAVDFIRDISVGNVADKEFAAAKVKLITMIRRRK